MQVVKIKPICYNIKKYMRIGDFMQKDFNFKTLLNLVIPTIFMMSFMSLYTIIDGAFVSKLVGTDALSAVNIAYPYMNFILGISVMLGSGGCALVMKKLGEGRETEAKKDFSLILIFAFLLSIFLSIFCLIFIDKILKILGTTDKLYYHTKNYLLYLIIFTMPTTLKFIVEQFLIASGKEKIALILSVSGGILNIILDYIFIAKFKLGAGGAGIATGIGYAIPALIGLIFFIKKDNMLHFTLPSKDFKVITNSCFNGSSEMISQISSGIITFLFNLVMLKYIGEDGVASITIVLYIQFLVTAVFLGYSMGIAPKISFYYGEKNDNMLKTIVSLSLKFIAIVSIIIYILIQIFSKNLIMFFTPENSPVFDITAKGLLIYSLSFLLVGFNIFLSSMFTAFSNGKISAIISFLKSLIFQSSFIVLLPIFLGVSGIWLAVVIGEVLGILISFSFYFKYKKIYKY